MQTKKLQNFFKDNTKLYIEHKGTIYQSFPNERQFMIIAYIAYGQGTVVIGNNRFSAVQKDIFIINPGIRTEFIMSKNVPNPIFEIYFICFEKDYLQIEWENYIRDFSELEFFLKNNGQSYLKVSDNKKCEIRNCIVRIINEYYEDTPGRDSSILGYMIILIPMILRRNNMTEKHIFSNNMLVDQTIRQIRSAIYKNPKPSEIAARRFVTREHLGRVFKQETGMTITQYTNSVRIEIVKDILRNTDRPIEDIPLLFNTKLKYLQQTFKHYTGMTMREYRSKEHYK